MISDLLRYADAETRHIVIFAVIRARHFPPVSPPTSAQLADCRQPSGNTVDHAGGGIDISLPVAANRGKRKRFRALNDRSFTHIAADPIPIAS